MKIISAIASKLPFTSRKHAAELAHKAHMHETEAKYLREQLAQAHRANVRLRAELAEESIGNR